MRTLALALSSVALLAPVSTAQDLDEVSSGLYELERNHAFLTWSVRHFGISDYIVNFTDFDATLDFNAEDPAASSLEVTIDPTGLETKYPDPEKKQEWETELGTDAKWFNAGEFPEITFTSTAVEVTGETSGKVTGDLTFLGVTRPVTLDVTYGGVANPPWYGQRDVIGFNASTTLNRSDFGLETMAAAVSDEVTIRFSGEFLQAE